MYNFNKSIKGSLDLIQELNQFRQSAQASPMTFLFRAFIFILFYSMCLYIYVFNIKLLSAYITCVSYRKYSI